MDRALKLEVLREALGEHSVPSDSTGQAALPSPADLQRLLGDTEASLFLAQHNLPDELLRTAWYLHGIASADAAASQYSVARRRQAFAVSAHIFDLAALPKDRPQLDRLRWAFAAEVGYHRSDAQPNAMAIARRMDDQIRTDAVLDHWSSLAIEAGVALLGLNPGPLAGRLRGWRTQLRQLAESIAVEDMTSTMFGPTTCVVEGVDALAGFLTRGDRDLLERARERFVAAVSTPEGWGDNDARWVAAHLRFICDELDSGSIWTLLPPNVPDGAKHAFSLTPPAILTLWEPQRRLLTDDDDLRDEESQSDAADSETRSILDLSVRRLVLSVPTSSGKTLLAQLLMVTHLATASTGVCYVTPLRSLGREVRRSLSQRLRVMAREVAREEPDSGLPEMLQAALGINLASSTGANGQEAPPDVVIMTPERLSHALREDAQAVLDRFGFFVFDEAHLIGERTRGFLLESILAFLHWRTLNTHHRIALLSAAMGNSGQLVHWLDVEGGARLFQSDWRGPRRLHAIFSTEIDWTNQAVEHVAAGGRLAHLTRRLLYPTFGVVRLRPAEHHPLRVRTTEALGTVSFRARADLIREGGVEQSHSTPFYKMLAEIVRYVSHAGPVLVVRSTRRDVVAMASAIADGLPDRDSARQLVDLARAKLGADHPLVNVLMKGVAFHHAGLPTELLEAIEEGVRTDAIVFLVATSTLTEGVNLPVRTVVLAATSYPDQPEDQQLRGARLVNAMGRAGRATRESEGWVILAHQATPQNSDFALFEPDSDTLEVHSRLTDAEALEALAVFEHALRESEDAVVAAHGAVADFVSYVWFVLAAEEELGRVGEAADPIGAFAATLAYTQLDPEIRARLEGVVQAVRSAYEASPSERRRGWARVGTSISTARSLDSLTDEIVDAVLSASDDAASLLTDPLGALDLLQGLDVLNRLLELPERPRPWMFRRTESGLSALVAVDPAEFVRLWLTGPSLPEMANTLLQDIPDESLRVERLVDAVSDFCEHYFSWMLGALVGQVNNRLTERGAANERQLCPQLPVFVRYGVSSIEAIELLTSGMRSRELVGRVASAARAENVEVSGLRDWLGQMGLATWVTRFDATPADLLDLLEYCRIRGSDTIRRLLAEGVSTITIDLMPVQDSDGEVTRELSDGDEEAQAEQQVVVRPVEDHLRPAPLGIYLPDSNLQLGTIPAPLHAEVQVLLETGLDIDAYLASDQLSLRRSD